MDGNDPVRRSISESCCWQERGLRSYRRHQHLRVPVPQQAEVCELQEEAHEPCMQGRIGLGSLSILQDLSAFGRCLLFLSSHSDAGAEEHQPSSGTLPLPLARKDPVAHHPRHGASETTDVGRSSEHGLVFNSTRLVFFEGCFCLLDQIKSCLFPSCQVPHKTARGAAALDKRLGTRKEDG